MVGLERRQQAQGKLLLGGILCIRRRFWGPLFGRDALLLEHLGLLIPRTERLSGNFVTLLQRYQAAFLR